MQQLANQTNGPFERKAYTIEEVASLLGVHRVTVYRRLYAGELKVLKGFGRLMVPAGELDKFLNRVVEYTPRRTSRRKAVAV